MDRYLDWDWARRRPSYRRSLFFRKTSAISPELPLVARETRHDPPEASHADAYERRYAGSQKRGVARTGERRDDRRPLDDICRKASRTINADHRSIHETR